MLNHGTRICDVCADAIPPGAPYRVGILRPDVAAGLLDTDRPELVPTWTAIGGGFVELDICLGCYRDMDGPTYTTERIHQVH